MRRPKGGANRFVWRSAGDQARLRDRAIKRWATVATGRRFRTANASSFPSSVSLNMTATRFLRAFGDGPDPEPFGRPAPGLRPPQFDFFFDFGLVFLFGRDAFAELRFFLAAIPISQLIAQG